jgi:hypothetical protein
MALLVMVVASVCLVKAAQAIGGYLSPEFECKQAIELTIQNGDTISELVEGQIVSGNCEGYEDLTAYLVDVHGTDLEPGQKIQIPVGR